MSKWVEAFRYEFELALPEAKAFKINSPTKCAEAIAFKASASSLAKELIAECDTMIDELRDTVQILEQKIDAWQKMSLVKPKKPTTKEIEGFDL